MVTNFIENKNRKIAFLPIEGNLDVETASTLFALGSEWKETTLINVPNLFLILDDPFLRWSRLVCQNYQNVTYINLGYSEDDFFDFLFYNKINCENIIRSQYQIFLRSNATKICKKITYFKLDRRLGYNLNHFLHEKNISNKFNFYEPSINDQLFDKLHQFIHTEINKPYLNKITKHLKDDYDFINSIEFYAR